MHRYLLCIMVVFAVLVYVVPSSFVFASTSEVVFTARYRQDMPVTLDLPSRDEVISLDPAIATDSTSIDAIENLFLGLTDLDPVTGQTRPEMATSWDVSDDGLTWTFHLRDDVMWMYYNPATESVAALRSVVAEDFVYGIKRACDPRLGGYYGTVIARVIAGCDVVNLTPPEEVTDGLVFSDTTRVYAVDSSTLVVELQFSAGYFFSMTSMWSMFALPNETIREHGDEWTQPGHIVTNGPYFVHGNVSGFGRVFIRNEALPAALHDGGNVERVVYHYFEESSTAFTLYHREFLDTTNVPLVEMAQVLANDSPEIVQIYDLAVFYFGFFHDKPPFDNVHVRRAFSAIIDREAFIQQIRRGRAVPMIHFTPPGMLHAPPLDEVGVGYDPHYAREQMALAGYPDCEDFPHVDIIIYQQAEPWAEFWIAAAERELGCDPEFFNIEQLELNFIPEPGLLETPIQDYPNAWTLGWAPDYPDAQNWVGDVLWCESPPNIYQENSSSLQSPLKRLCSTVDTLIEQAAAETNQSRRAELYHQIEEAFFGPEGEFPIAPIYLRTSYILVKSWYTGPHQTDGLFGGPHWSAYAIDMAAKLAARGE